MTAPFDADDILDEFDDDSFVEFDDIEAMDPGDVCLGCGGPLDEFEIDFHFCDECADKMEMD